MEILSVPGVGGIIERNVEGIDYILVQERCKEQAPQERGLIEIPAGKIREYENIFDCLRREVKEETGLDVIEIDGEKDSTIYESNGYKVLNYNSFAIAQNLEGYYPIMVQVFICKVEGHLLKETNESRNIRWISLQDLSKKLREEEQNLYPMHVITLSKYLRSKGY